MWHYNTNVQGRTLFVLLVECCYVSLFAARHYSFVLSGTLVLKYLFTAFRWDIPIVFYRILYIKLKSFLFVYLYLIQIHISEPI
jgi:hypothetical protein